MWYLLYIALMMDHATWMVREGKTEVLETYDNATECHAHKQYVRDEMAKAYPGDFTFLIDCRQYSVSVTKPPSPVPAEVSLDP